jgi:2-amino-4-hydroxy-6-hydroxymethyldihydropteridine diphosphokinase
VKTVYLGLGSNIGDREGMLQSAIDRLPAPDLVVKNVSPVFETEPMGFEDQRHFLNMAVEVETDLFPLMLLARIQKIELALGRKRSGPRNGPRTLDLDILFYGHATVHGGKLEIPHPRLHERRFVLAPMAELAPDLRHPQLHKTMRELLTGVEGQRVRRIDFVPLLNKIARC